MKDLFIDNNDAFFDIIDFSKPVETNNYTFGNLCKTNEDLIRTYPTYF